jgi:iron complex transport system ATP-binding protein
MNFSVKNGCFGYKENDNVLDDINFSVDEAEVLSILGANGVGKTTLIKCMLGLLKWKCGETDIDERNVTTMKQKEFWSKVGYVPQAKINTFVYTVEEMVVLGRSPRLGDWEQPRKQDYEIACDCLETLGILHLKDKLCNEISGGEYQLVLIARALASEPKLLVLDEPESNLDFKNQLIVCDAIVKLRKERHISAIINTHFPEHALTLSQKTLLLLNDGSTIYGKTDVIVNEENLSRAFNMTVYVRDVDLPEGAHTCVIARSRKLEV